MRRSRTPTASWMFFIPNALSATPGIGNVRVTDPAVTTRMSYSSVHGSPSSGVKVATFAPESISVMRAGTTRVRFK